MSAPRNDTSRRLTCGRCGTAFTCDLSGQCWCAGEAARLPLPKPGDDCLCPTCLRATAAAQEQRQTG
ncbi:MAG: cysteine-rich CWC family protein [Xanthobacteraceae bacterium]